MDAVTTRILDTIAYIAAESSPNEKAVIARVLYAASLAAELNLTPAKASDVSAKAAWSGPARRISDESDARINDWRGIQVMEDCVDFWHIAPDIREAARELICQGKKIQAIKLLKETGPYNLRQAKDIVDDIASEHAATHADGSDFADMQPPF